MNTTSTPAPSRRPCTTVCRRCPGPSAPQVATPVCQCRVMGRGGGRKCTCCCAPCSTPCSARLHAERCVGYTAHCPSGRLGRKEARFWCLSCPIPLRPAAPPWRRAPPSPGAPCEAALPSPALPCPFPRALPSGLCPPPFPGPPPCRAVGPTPRRPAPPVRVLRGPPRLQGHRRCAARQAPAKRERRGRAQTPGRGGGRGGRQGAGRGGGGGGGRAQRQGTGGG